MRILVHGDFDIRLKLCNGNERSAHGHRYGDNPEKDYEKFFRDIAYGFRLVELTVLRIKGVKGELF